MKFSIKDFFSKCDQIRSGWVLILVKLRAEACNFTKINTPPLRISLHLLKKFLMENFIFCAMNYC